MLGCWSAFKIETCEVSIIKNHVESHDYSSDLPDGCGWDPLIWIVEDDVLDCDLLVRYHVSCGKHTTIGPMPEMSHLQDAFGMEHGVIVGQADG